MPRFVRTAVVDREALAEGLVGRLELQMRAAPIDDRTFGSLPARGALIVSWSEEGADPLPDLIVVRDEDLHDTLAWLSAFMAPLTPVTQWCRVLTSGQAQSVLGKGRKPQLTGTLTLWIGAIIAECAAQAGPTLSLKDLPGTAALSTASFGAARAIAVHGSSIPLKELAQRHDDLATRLRSESRPLTSTQLLPLWSCLDIEGRWQGATSDERALRPIRELLKTILRSDEPSDGKISQAVRFMTDEFDLPDLIACSRGPQADRVLALDNLIEKITVGPKTSITDALIGFAASLVEPGASVLPELLRKYFRAAPVAPVWLGAFAGAWEPIRLLTEHQGLGRIVSKAVLAPSDLHSKPACDVAADELLRWIGASAPAKLPVRGMAARSLSVEILPGVTSYFALGRTELNRAESAPNDARSAYSGQGTSGAGNYGEHNRRFAAVDDLARLQQAVRALQDRLARLEAAGLSPSSHTREPSGAGAVTDSDLFRSAGGASGAASGTDKRSRRTSTKDR